MPLGTLDRSAPSFFRQGPSPLSRLALYSALALFLMVADARFQITEPVRKAISAVLYPLQWTMLQPVEFAGRGAGYFQSLQAAEESKDAAERRMAEMSQRANQTELLLQENTRLRKLLELRERLDTPSQAAQVIYDTADPYTRRVMIDRGQTAGVELGSPVLDEGGILGQVTRVHPFLSEVTLLVDRDQAIPVLNVRTGARSVAYGDPIAGHGGGMELRFMPGNADVQEGDLLTTSGVDGLYPPGLPVARVVRVERRADSAFARIYCTPLAQVYGARHVMVLKPLVAELPERPAPAVQPKRGGRR
ncbi:rod shape-determining protein MreC [Paracidovorax wautersii]|uniref:Cell shape-determining protein MreC n=1 Tax=Paracidovorax wautersii TaxID=1177982 RepID=A0ABU1IA57_9BURK|nr:rod shape-determining protein MreC [Paracidovorax wautersii]MDR6213328.1 rod shape-determining protein MreC [Paracidovorax wautersii]